MRNLFFGSALIAGVFLGWQENRDLSMWTDTFKGFLTKYQGKDPTDKFRGNFYSVSAVPASARQEYHIPRSVDCGPFLKNPAGGMRQFNHWFSSGGTSSVLHHDGFENLNCLLAGTKDLTFIDRSYSHDVKPRRASPVTKRERALM